LQHLPREIGIIGVSLTLKLKTAPLHSRLKNFVLARVSSPVFAFRRIQQRERAWQAAAVAGGCEVEKRKAARASHGGGLPGGVRAAGFAGRRKTGEETLGQYEVFQARIEEARFSVQVSETPIIPIHVEMLQRRSNSQRNSSKRAFSRLPSVYPIVAEGKARLRAIVSAAISESNCCARQTS